jgi:site-specific DNA recombinase
MKKNKGEPVRSEVAKALSYARVSSKEQEKEGFSIPAQQKLLQSYAANNRLLIVQEYVDVETAKATGRTNFEQMVRYLKTHANVRTVLVEKTDRLYTICAIGSRSTNSTSRFTW